jgi:hypothetical protein
MKQTTENNAGYEKRDINVVMVIGLSVFLVAILVIILVFLMDYFVETKEEMVYEIQLKPESVDLKTLEAEDKEILNSYEVLDTEQGVYRIPIERAMELLAKEESKTN